MAVRPRTDVELSGELEQIATAAAERLQAVSACDVERGAEWQRRVGEAASRAIAVGLSLAAIADAEQVGQGRSRAKLGPELLRRVDRAARRKREAEHEYEQAIVRAGRLGLAHRDVAATAQVAHGTVRAIIARAHGVSGHHDASTTSGAGGESGQQPAGVPAFIDVASEQARPTDTQAVTERAAKLIHGGVVRAAAAAALVVTPGEPAALSSDGG
jgi:hypothetical protein